VMGARPLVGAITRTVQLPESSPWQGYANTLVRRRP
jgi:hypothetical protein